MIAAHERGSSDECRHKTLTRQRWFSLTSNTCIQTEKGTHDNLPKISPPICMDMNTTMMWHVKNLVHGSHMHIIAYILVYRHTDEKNVLLNCNTSQGIIFIDNINYLIYPYLIHVQHKWVLRHLHFFWKIWLPRHEWAAFRPFRKENRTPCIHPTTSTTFSIK